MGAFRNSSKHFLMSLCIATLILGQVPFFQTIYASSDARQRSELHYKSAFAFGAHSGFVQQKQSLVVPDEDLFVSAPMPVEARPVLRPVVSELPSMRSIWHGLPPLRSPPFHA